MAMVGKNPTASGEFSLRDLGWGDFGHRANVFRASCLR